MTPDLTVGMRPDDVVTWLRATLDQMVRIAKGDVDNDEEAGWHTVGCGWNIGEFDRACECWGPEKALARVEAERAMLALHCPVPTSNAWGHGCDVCDNQGGWIVGDDPYPCQTVRWLAYAHRFDAPGWQVEWAPDGVQVPR